MRPTSLINLLCKFAFKNFFAFLLHHKTINKQKEYFHAPAHCEKGAARSNPQLDQIAEKKLLHDESMSQQAYIYMF
jgi:hypothetical protein